MYKFQHCSVTWFNHLQYTGGTSFQRSLADLLQTAGVGFRDDDDVPSFTQAYAFGVDSSEVREKLDTSIVTPILESIDKGNRGAYLVSHHIDTPGFLMIEKVMEQFKLEVENRGCRFLVTSLARDPLAHRTSEYLKFHTDVVLDSSLGGIRQREPNFPVTDGSRPFEQTREFLFLDELGSAAEQIKTEEGAAMAGDDAVAAIQAFQLIEDVAATAEARAMFNAPHATLAGVLSREVRGEDDGGVSGYELHLWEGLGGSVPLLGGGDLSNRFDAALEAVVRTASRLIQKFDVQVLNTEDQLGGLQRLAQVMDWHPELLDGTFGETDELQAMRQSVSSPLNTHHGDSAEKVSIALDQLPDKHRRELQRWTELDAALYLVGVAQGKAHFEQKKVQGDMSAGVGMDERPSNSPCSTQEGGMLEHAFTLARRSRAEREKGIGLGGMIGRVETANGCLGAVVDETNGLAEDDVPVEVREAEEGAEGAAMEVNEGAERPVEEVAQQPEEVVAVPVEEVPLPVAEQPVEVTMPEELQQVQESSASRNEVVKMLNVIQSTSDEVGVDGFPDASDLPIVTAGTVEGEMTAGLGIRIVGAHKIGTAERLVERAIGFDVESEKNENANLGLKETSADLKKGNRLGIAERMVERAIGFGE